MEHVGRYWHRLADGRVQCDLCPRYCRLREGQFGSCSVRANVDGHLVVPTCGRSPGFAIHPIEQKPLNHFLPGSSVFSVGAVGSNLDCRLCQSGRGEMDCLPDAISPVQIAEAARAHGCSAVAHTGGDPVVFPERAIDLALACRERGLANVVVTAGYVNPEARADLFAVVDAANVALQGFNDGFYQRVTGGRLQPVLDTIRYLAHQTGVWLELTTMLIPGHNDATSELTEMCDWLVQEVGPDVPLHFTAFHPGNRVSHMPATPSRTLVRARLIGLEAGLQHVYIASAHDPDGNTTSCPNCHTPVVRRERCTVESYQLDAHGRCQVCGSTIPGRFAAEAGERLTAHA